MNTKTVFIVGGKSRYESMAKALNAAMTIERRTGAIVSIESKIIKTRNPVYERTIRKHNQWCKITRKSDKSFCLARGYKGEIKAHDVCEYSADYLPTWKDALDFAYTKLDSYK